MNDASANDAEDDQDLLTPKVEAKAETTKLPATTQHKAQVTAQTSVMALTPRNLDEAWRMAEAFRTAGMVPKSLEGKGEKETTGQGHAGHPEGSRGRIWACDSRINHHDHQ